MNLKQTAKDNLAVTIISTLAAIALGAVAIAEGFDLADKLHMTEPEAEIIHAAMYTEIADVGLKIDTQAKLNECRWLDDKIDGLKYEIYILNRDKASPDYIRDKEDALEKTAKKYDALRCVTLI